MAANMRFLFTPRRVSLASKRGRTAGLWFLVAGLSLSIGCSNETAESGGAESSELRNSQEQLDGGSDSETRRVKYLDYRDAEMGMIQYSIPFPPGWRFDPNPNDKLQLIGPNGTEVYQTNSGQYAYSDDPFARESAEMSGAQIAPVMDLDDFLTQEFAPYMGEGGYRLTSRFPLPKILNFWELFGAAMPQGLSRRQYDVVGAEWERDDGTKALTVLTQTILTRGQFVSWSVFAGELYSSSDAYEKAKDAYIYASENIRMNPEWQIAKNNQLLAQIRASEQVWDERMRQSSIQHAARMNSILARSETSSSVAKINSDILDISHSGYLKRSDMVSAGQAREVNMLSGQTVISNPTTGERYQVEARQGNYWVNGSGEYFSTEDASYNPNRDQSLNNQNWTQFEVSP